MLRYTFANNPVNYVYSYVVARPPFRIEVRATTRKRTCKHYTKAASNSESFRVRSLELNNSDRKLGHCLLRHTGAGRVRVYRVCITLMRFAANTGSVDPDLRV